MSMLKQDHLFHYPVEFQLESGAKLPGFQLKYTTLGQLNKERDNVVWVCHALTGSSDFTDWWSGLFDENGAFDPRNYFIISANALGGCYGSTGPLSLNPLTQQPYYHDFPFITNRDIVQGFDLLRENLGINHIHTLIGGSQGGQQVLEWAIQRPKLFSQIIPIACNAFHSPWGIAFNEAQRMAIEADATWKLKEPRAGIEGMKAARAMGMISFRTPEIYGKTQAEKTNEVTDQFRAASYQRYQGQKLANRFNAFSYWTLTKAMDSHNVGRGRPSVEEALGFIQARALVVGVGSDLFFPFPEQEFLAKYIKGAELRNIQSAYGHDGFLAELDVLKDIVRKFSKTELKKVEL
jgi:homoserine O-acetyltransferase/O-succinyltransferase